MITFKIAFRNILLHKLKTTIIGLILLFGTVTAILGNALVDAVAAGIRNSLTNSVTGDIQIYSSDAKEKFSLFPGPEGNMPDIGHVNDFRRVKETLLKSIPNIRTIVPMGANVAMLNPGNLLDIKLEELRKLFQERPGQTGANTNRADSIRTRKEHIREIIRDLQGSYANAELYNSMMNAKERVFRDAPKNIEKTLSPAFWSGFDSNAESRIETLANDIAPLIFDDTMVYFSYLGTLPGVFRESFPLFEMVKGQPIPEGRKGFLFNDFIYENMLKHRIARRLDQMKKKIVQEGKTIHSSKTLQEWVALNLAQTGEIHNQLDPPAVRHIVPELQAFLGQAAPESKTADIKELLHAFLAMDDSNFLKRYAFFYDSIAPHILLYRIAIGDVFPVTGFAKSGYSSSINLKVYGTFRFKSFESSPIAGNFNLMDLVSFRDLFGFMTSDLREETRQLEKEMESDAPASHFPLTDPQIRIQRKSGDTTYTQAEMEDGIFLNAAVILKDRSWLGIRRTLTEIQEISKRENLGIRAVDWQDAAGMIGQLTFMVRIILYSFVFIIFLVATFIITNALLMATFERTREIGTMRAIGAQRKFIQHLLLQETLILSLIFGTLGTLIGAGIIGVLGRIGIPAMGDISMFFFSGDRLYLTLNWIPVFAVLALITGVAVLATQYPAWRAMRISPIRAMHKGQ